MKPVIADDHPIFRAGLRQILETDATLRDRSSPPRVILLTLHVDGRFLNKALDVGAYGYVPKRTRSLNRFAVTHQSSLSRVEP